MVRPGWLTRLLGDKGERLAVRHLRQVGFKILDRNVRNRLGEIDIIARDGDCVVFVEVKTRTSHAAGHPTEALTPFKQRQLTRVALTWLKSRGLLEHRARFDVVAITWQAPEKPSVQHYRSAFESTGTGQFFS